MDRSRGNKISLEVANKGAFFFVGLALEVLGLQWCCFKLLCLHQIRFFCLLSVSNEQTTP